jgi:hypothetical protein
MSSLGPIPLDALARCLTCFNVILKDHLDVRAERTPIFLRKLFKFGL